MVVGIPGLWAFGDPLDRDLGQSTTTSGLTGWIPYLATIRQWEQRRSENLTFSLSELPIIPHAAQLFVEHTFSIIESGNLCAIATAFNYGQYDLHGCVTKSLQAIRQLRPSKPLREARIGQLAHTRGTTAREAARLFLSPLKPHPSSLFNNLPSINRL